MSIEINFSWADLYSEWEMFSMVTGWKQEFPCTPILVSSPLDGRRIGHEIYDWWPTEDIPRRIASLEENGLMGVYWETKKGILQTAELLCKFKNDPEAQAAIFLAAAIWEMTHPLPEAWRGDISRLTGNMFNQIVSDPKSPFIKHSIYRWHHAMRSTIPESIVTDDFSEFCKPREYKDIVYIAFLEAKLSIASWTPVIVSHDENNPKNKNA